MARIFISYRRDDTAAYAGRLNEHLSREFGKKRVFMDIDDIEPGQKFASVLRETLRKCQVVLVLIGKGWLAAADAAGRRRLDDPSDFVRMEVQTALDAGVRVIPVLVGGAKIPGAADMPAPMRGLASLQAHEVLDDRWDYDLGRLVHAIRGRSVLAWIKRHKLLTGVAVWALAAVSAFPLVTHLTGGAVEGAEQFLDAVARNDLDAAYRSTSAALQARLPRKEFAAAVEHLGLGDSAGASWTSRSIEGGAATLKGTVTTRGGGQIPLTVTLVKEEKAWKVLSVSGPRVGLEATQ
jgi:hypothetical protein